jgi:hypothetical protein
MHRCLRSTGFCALPAARPGNPGVDDTGDGERPSADQKRGSERLCAGGIVGEGPAMVVDGDRERPRDAPCRLRVADVPLAAEKDCGAHAGRSDASSEEKPRWEQRNAA